MIRWLREKFGFGAEPSVGVSRAQALSLVRRARAGDQNAMAMIAGTYRAAIAQQAHTGQAQARASLQTILDVIKKNPAKKTAVAFGATSDPGPMTDVVASITNLPPPVQPPIPPATAILSTPALKPSPEAAAHLGILKWASRGGADDPTDLWCLRLCGQALLCCASCGDSTAIPIAIVILSQGAPLSATRIVSMIEQAPPEMQGPLDMAITHSADSPDPYEAARFSAGPPAIDSVREAGRAIGQARRLQCMRLPGAQLALYCPVMAGEVADMQPHDRYGYPIETRTANTQSELRNAS